MAFSISFARSVLYIGRHVSKGRKITLWQGQADSGGLQFSPSR